MTNEDGELLCSRCTKDMENVMVNKAVQNMINKLKTGCLTLGSAHAHAADQDEEGAHLLITGAPRDLYMCDWEGRIQDWPEHVKVCPFLMVACADCRSFQGQRRELTAHVNQCPEVTIDCPLSCGM